ncbi:hypothetical protein H6F96_28585 [Microcoleus sp. FACHB-53]|nr:hypothetical protein [Microcoleus sp. FACHB-53]MBD2130599.1 hypothetical protein [Microcoleus sp. FACHB-1]
MNSTLTPLIIRTETEITNTLFFPQRFSNTGNRKGDRSVNSTSGLIAQPKCLPMNTL